MGVRDIAVHLDDSARCAARLDMALTLAKVSFARVTGVFAQSDPNVPGIIASWPTEAFSQAMQRVHDGFLQAAAAAGVQCHWLAVPSGEHAYINRAVTLAAACADLVIMGQHESDRGHGLLPLDLAEQVILHSGRPVLMVPFAGHFDSVGRRPLIAWNGGRQAVRALHDALPLMSHARQATLVVIENGSSSIDEGPILQHLANHGINAEVERLVAEDIGVMDLLLARVADTGCDLLVMGAHGHYCFPRLNRGSGTRHILHHMTAPTLMSA